MVGKICGERMYVHLAKLDAILYVMQGTKDMQIE
jgi:hypothetical protein